MLGAEVERLKEYGEEPGSDMLTSYAPSTATEGDTKEHKKLLESYNELQKDYYDLRGRLTK